jgi:CarD family transcriptional regulator
MPAKTAKTAKAAAKSASKGAKKPAKKPAPKKPVAKKTAKKPVMAKKPAKKPAAKKPVRRPAPAPKAKAKKPVAKAMAQAAVATKAPVKPAAATAALPPVQKDRGSDGVRKDIMTSVAAKKITNRHGFKTSEFIVYPAHGVGQIVAIEEQEIAGYKLELFVITFAKDKMTLRVPISKVDSVGMRKLSADDIMTRALDTLKGRARVKRTMWSRRAQEYEAKINSGDLVAIAEVVRDLHRAETQPEQSYSERQLYEAALDRMAREIAAVEKLTDPEAVKKIEAMLAKGPKRGVAKAEEAEAEDAPEGNAAEAA